MSECHKIYFRLIFVISCLFQVNHSANVLCMFTSPLIPNLKVYMAVANALIDRDHNLTIITTIPIPSDSIPKKNFRHILLMDTFIKMQQRINQINSEITDDGFFHGFFETVDYLTSIQINALMQREFKEFFAEDNKFDLMILGYLLNDFMVGIAPRYNCPIAVVGLSGPFGELAEWIGNPSAISYVQIPFLGNNQPMTFIERLRNLMMYAVEPFAQAYSNRVMENIYRTLFTDESYPPYSDVISNISLVLYNRHFSEMPVRPLVPALVEIGGIQDEDQSEYLPKDIKEFIDSAENGAIFFRVGSIARNTELKPDQLKIILNVLSKLDQKIVWEWERPENPPTGYPNILFRPSITPNTILPHRNIKLYITDGRPLAIQGATYHGVQMLGLPIFGEEPYSVAEMTNSELGVSIDVTTMTEKSFNETLSKVLYSHYYADKVKKFSQLFRDRPNTARETAAFWLEYVIRHRGAMHMQSPLVHMNFVKRWNIDVILALIITVWVFVKLALITGFIVRTVVDRRAAIRLNTEYKLKLQ